MKTISPYQVPVGSTFRMTDVDPDDKSAYPVSKSEGKKLLPEKSARLLELQRRLFAEDKHRVLIVIQTMDAGGKDSTIRHVFGPLEAADVRVVAFKAPNSLELSHDYLWRIHKEAPKLGEIVIFNRSHYEDIIAVGVKDLLPESVWEKRYDHIVNFEQMLADENTLVLKFFLCISKEEQRERFQERVDNPEKRWKFNAADLEDRAKWDEFMAAYEDVINRTNTKSAPWFVIPANRKWHRNLVISDIVADALEALDMNYPEPDFDPSEFAKIE